MLCKNCGSRVDDHSNFCTKCGAPINQTATPSTAQTKKKPIYKKWWFWVIIALAILIIGSSGSNTGSSNPTNPPAPAAPQAIKVSAEDLREAYEQNEVAAEKKYGDQLVEVTGIVNNVGTDILNNVYVTLSTGEYLKSIQCYFEADDEIDKVATLVEGQEVTILGTCNGLSLTNVTVKECSFASISSPGVGNSQTSTEPGNNIIEITAADLFAAYSENEVAANGKYKDKKLQITGTINHIGTDILDRVYITLEAGEMLYSVQCYFVDSDEAAKVAELRKGDTITLIGVCEGMSLNVMVRQCEIL